MRQWVVFGRIDFIDIISGYNLFKNYCLRNNINFDDYPEDSLILIQDVPNLKVFNNIEKEIKGLGCSISGMDSDSFDITIVGIDYPFYVEEFPHHVKAEKERLEKPQ